MVTDQAAERRSAASRKAALARWSKVRSRERRPRKPATINEQQLRRLAAAILLRALDDLILPPDTSKRTPGERQERAEAIRSAAAFFSLQRSHDFRWVCRALDLRPGPVLRVVYGDRASLIELVERMRYHYLDEGYTHPGPSASVVRARQTRAIGGQTEYGPVYIERPGRKHYQPF